MDIERIKNRYRNLPRHVRDAIASFDVASVVQEIVKEHRLHIDQGGELADEIDNVLVGDTEREVFLPNIKKRLDIDDETAKEIVGEVNENILIPIKKQMQREKDEEDPDDTSRERARQTQTAPAENIDKEALGKIEKDKYREPIENEDIVLNTDSIADTPRPPAGHEQKEPAEEPFDRASVLREIEDSEEGSSEQPLQTETPEPVEKTGNEDQPKETPRPSMVRDLISEAREQQTRQAKKSIARENATSEPAPTPPQENTSENTPAAKTPLPKAKQEERGEQPSSENSEVRKKEIKNDPYREPIN